MFDGAKRNQANQAGSLSGAQSLSADQRAKANASLIQPISADQRSRIVTGSGAAPADPLTVSLAAYWKFDEPATGPRLDSLGITDLTDNNTVGATSGIISNGALFDATNSETLTAVSNSNVQLSSSFSWNICGWFRSSKSGVQGIIEKITGGGAREWSLNFYSHLGFIFFDLYDGNITNIGELTLSGVPNTTYFISVGYDVDLNQTFGSVNDGAVVLQALTGSLVAGNADLRFGSFNASSNFYSGWMDEFGIWKRRLTAAEVTRLYNAGAGLTYPFTS
jgi:hypothetical protein